MSLIEEVLQLNQELSGNPEGYHQRRKAELLVRQQQATTEAFQHLTERTVDLIKQAAGSLDKQNQPRREARLYEWNFRDRPQFNGCYLRDLLERGTLLEDLQGWFDKNHTQANGDSAFKVYYFRTLRGGALSGVKKGLSGNYHYTLTVSWDQDDWERIDQLLSRRQNKATEVIALKEETTT